MFSCFGLRVSVVGYNSLCIFGLSTDTPVAGGSVVENVYFIARRFRKLRRFFLTECFFRSTDDTD